MSAPVKASKTSRTTIAVLAILTILSLVILLFVRIPSGGRPLSPSSTSPDGTRAAAQILQDHGIAVQEVNPVEAVPLAGPDTTLVIDEAAYFDEDTRRSLIDSRATIIVLEGAWFEDWGLSGSLRNINTSRLRAECDDPDAQAASAIGPVGKVFEPDDPIEGCFPAGDAYVWVELPDNPQISFLADSSVLTNEFLDMQGNAAFTLRKLGSQPRLYWLSGSGIDMGGRDNTGIWAGVPSWFFPLATALTMSLGWWALYRGRRFGKLVAEPLPVVVPASEVNEGRSILYQRGRNFNHAARALRAGTISRLARGRGLSDDAHPDSVITSLARASGYPPSAVADLLYNRPITGDSDLVALATELDRFERDINVQ